MSYLAPKGTGCLSVAPQTVGDNPGTRYLDTSNFLAARGTGCLPPALQTTVDDPGTRYLEAEGTRSLHPPHQERVRHLLYGSLAGLDRTIKILHTLTPTTGQNPSPPANPTSGW